jgi:serine phosphatase RsbU (regulator of sigma subunit)/putative methionine-R-sulfoxide reductase with GAF domain
MVSGENGSAAPSRIHSSVPPDSHTTLDQQALQRLQQISAEILGQLDLDRLLASILQGAADLLSASQTNLYRYLPDRDLLATWIPFRVPEGFVTLELTRGEGMGGTVLATGKGFKLADYDRWEGRTLKWPSGVTGPSLAVPVRRRDEWLGVITAGRPHGGTLFTDQDLELLQLFANQAAVAIANAQLYASVSRKADELSKLYDTSLDIVSQLDLTRVLQATLERATDLMDCSANLRLYDPQKGLLIPLLPFKQSNDIAYASLRPGEGLSGRVFVTGEALVVNDYDHWEGRSSQYPPGVIARAMAAPLREGGKAIGVLALDRTADRPPFTDDDLQLLSLFANQASVAITNARQVEQLKHFHAQQIEKERLDQQLRTAQAVQAGLLPLELPAIPGWDVAALWRPALQLGGDYYDFIPLAPDRWGLLMADVSDKGIPAALLMAVARSLFRVYAAADTPPHETLSRVNRDLVASSHSGMFVTALYAILETDTGALRIASAGHPPAQVVRHPGREVQALRVGGMPLGILEEAVFTEQATHLEPHEIIVLYTDGITEASDSTGEQFGPARLQAFLGQGAAASSRQIIAGLDEAVRSFVGETPPSDDVAYLVVRREA